MGAERSRSTHRRRGDRGGVKRTGRDGVRRGVGALTDVKVG